MVAEFKPSNLYGRLLGHVYSKAEGTAMHYAGNWASTQDTRAT